jgi:hypothetical protein
MERAILSMLDVSAGGRYILNRSHGGDLLEPDSMGSVRPNGVKIVIAYLLLSIGVGLGHLCLLLLVGYPPGIEYFNLLSSTIIAIGIVGLWRMTRWGLWLTIVMGVVGLVAGSYNLVKWMGQFYAIMGYSFFPKLLNLFFGIYGGPVQLIGSTLTIAYLYKRRRNFL